MASYPKIFGLDFNPPQSATSTDSKDSNDTNEEHLEAYITNSSRIIEAEVPPGVPALPLAINGLVSPKEVPVEEHKGKTKVAKDAEKSVKDEKAPADVPEQIPASSSGSKPGTGTTTGSGTVDSTDCAIPTQYAHPKRSLKKLQKSKKDKEREISHLLKTWSNLSVEEKYNNMCEKYVDLHDDTKKMQMKLYLTEKDIAVLMKEKGQWQTEQNKLVMQRSRLEGVCRELQKQNKQIKEESTLRIREEEERRKEVSSKFQATLNEVSAIMAQNTEKNTKLRDDNIDITNKFKTLCDQFEKREDQMIRMAKQMELEKQLSEAQIKKLDFEYKAARETWAREREIAKQNFKSSEEKVDTLHVHIADLENHLRIYTDKYTEFETTISKSNKVFDNYKSEMGKLSKQMSKVDKESQAWKNRWEKNAQAILELTETNQMQAQVLKKSEKRLEQMQNLCRQLQMERMAYLSILRANGLDPVISSVTIEDVCPNGDAFKSQKEIELGILQEEMANLKKKLNEEEEAATKENRSSTNSPDVAKQQTPTKKKSRKRGRGKGANEGNKPEQQLEEPILEKTDAVKDTRESDTGVAEAAETSEIANVVIKEEATEMAPVEDAGAKVAEEAPVQVVEENKPQVVNQEGVGAIAKEKNTPAIEALVVESATAGNP